MFISIKLSIKGFILSDDLFLPCQFQIRLIFLFLYSILHFYTTMATKSEDIRLQINNVRHKKGDGVLYLMAERLAWMPNTKNNFTLSHKYSDIKMQKISPEGRAKIQLQIVLHTGDNTTFQFNNLEDRTAVKDSLLQILPQFKGKMPKDREKKAILLSKNPNLLQLYKDLVETKIVSADEFWTQFVDEHSEPIECQVQQQDVGVSADFLAGIPLNGKQVKGNVNVETLWAILKTYPKVAKKHQELVPTKMSETEFWNKFFQSRYFNRDRTKDLFSDCVKSDEKEWTSVVKKGILDPFLDIDMFNDNAYQGAADDPPPSSSHENPDQLLIKRFNQQSIRLLESLESKNKSGSTSLDKQPSSGDAADPQVASTSNDRAAETNGTTSGIKEKQAEPEATATASSSNEEAQMASFRANRRDWTYDDLAGTENSGDFQDDQSKIGSKMHEVDKDKYIIVPQGQQAAYNLNTIKDHIESMKSWDPCLTDCVSPKDATEALKNLSPGGYLMRSTNTNRLEDTVPEELQAKLKRIYFASNELLRHFWLCFPAVEPSLESKLIKLHDTLKKFESTKLQTFYDSLSRDQRHLLNHIMRGQFKSASRKYDSWKSKRRQRAV